MDAIVLRPSAAETWTKCTASVMAGRDIPDPPSGPAAREGTAAHIVAQRCLENGEVSAEDFVGIAIDVEGREILVTGEMVTGVNLYLDAIYSDLLPEDHLHVEAKVSAFDFGDFASRGTSDCVIVKHRRRRIDIVDLKYGFGIVENTSAQLRVYAAGALNKFGAGADIEAVSVTIVQPRAPHPDGPVRTATFSVAELMDFEFDVLSAVDEIRTGGEFVAGTHCKYCKVGRAGRCPRQNDEAQAAFSDIEDLASTMFPRAIGDDAARLLEMCDRLETWCAHTRERIEAEARTAIPSGLKWVAGSGRRSWSQADTATADLVLQATGVDVTEKRCLSVAQAEKLIGKKTFAEKCGSLVTRSPGKPKLVKLSDKGEALTLADVNGSGGAAGFSEIETL